MIYRERDVESESREHWRERGSERESRHQREKARQTINWRLTDEYINRFGLSKKALSEQP